jgi:formate dehydrogenase
MQYVGGGGNAMVPHMSGTTLDAQSRYAAGVKKILENYFSGKPQTPSDVIVENGSYATKYCSFIRCLMFRAYGQRK